ncbi:ankyrin repeat protein [Bandra megavirus]|uniref:Ankyrin repeat protein n=1 Tax=Bandra megavirus TaxID=2071566 RepID=A0A2K9V7F4_9VIRU|nr:ankyrin repeat protein [Bandra megavirus]
MTYTPSLNQMLIEQISLSVKDDNILTVKTLLESGSNINWKNMADDDQTPLMAAMTTSSRTNLAIVNLLLDNGAEINLRNRFGKTALILAVINDNDHLVNILLDKGANVNAQDNTGRTAIMYAVIYDSMPIANKLIQYGAKITIKDTTNKTAINLTKKWNNKIKLIFYKIIFLVTPKKN